MSRGISRQSASHGHNRNHASSLTFIFQSIEPAKYSTDIVTHPSPVEVGSFKEQSNTEKEEGNIGYRGGSCYPSNCSKTIRVHSASKRMDGLDAYLYVEVKLTLILISR